MARPVLSVAALLDGVRPLATAGFVVTDAWDGRISMSFVVNSLSRVESTLPPEHEERLLGIWVQHSFEAELAPARDEAVVGHDVLAIDVPFDRLP